MAAVAAPVIPASGVARRRLLLLVAAIIAGAGVAYELSLMLLGTVTVGATEQANAIVLGAAMTGMGIGATLGGRLAGRPVAAFVAVESVLAVLGAGAAPGLYWTWARLDSFWGPLLAVAVAIGLCIGAEMPLLASLNERLADQRPAEVVAAYTAADYFGALIGATAFAFAVRPALGLVSGTIAVAGANIVMAVAVVAIVPSSRSDRRRALLAVPFAVAAVAAIALGSGPIVRDGRQSLFEDPIVAVADTGPQQLVVTSRRYAHGVVDTRLFLDGDLQLSSLDEHRYHEALVHPAVRPGSALVLGGGDCLAVRELLRRPEVTDVTLVDLDPTVTALVRRTPELAKLTAGACDDPRLTRVAADALTWIGGAVDQHRRFATVVVDFPDPDTPALGRLYAVEMYQRVRSVLAPGGAAVVQCGSPFFAPEAFWTCEATLSAAGLSSVPYHVDVPSFGDWGFHLAAETTPQLVVPRLPTARFLTPEVLAAAGTFAPDLTRSRATAKPSTILDPTIVDAARSAWLGY